MDSILQDLRYAVRGLLKSLGFTLAAVLCFALGIGANATMFSVVNALMLKPPVGVQDPGRVVRLYFTQTSGVLGRFTQASTSYASYLDMRDGVPAFIEVAAASTPEDGFDVGRGAGATRVRGSLVSASFFPLLGIRPALGRFFGPGEDRPGSAPIAVLSHAFWQRHFGGDSGVVGRTVLVGRALCTIVGVAPGGFTGAGLRPVDLWAPLGAMGAITSQTEAEWFTNRGWTWVELLARLKPGASAAQAAAQATRVFRSRDATTDPSALVQVGPIQAARGPGATTGARLSLWLGVVSALVLLIACANVANLLLARAIRRRREVAVRLALGAGRWRLSRQLVTESLVLAALGGTAALLIALWGGPVITVYVLPEGAVPGAAVDLRVLGFAALIALLAGALTGLVPALQAGGPDLALSLKAGEREGTYQRSRMRAGLLVAQISLTLVLLAGTGLFVRSLANALQADIGLDARRVMVADVNVFNSGYPRSQVDELFLRLLQRAASVPGVERGAISIGGPLGWVFGRKVNVPGRDTVPTPRGGGPYVNGVTPDFFATLGIRIVEGRGFTAADHAGTAKVAVLGQAMARWLWPGSDPLGQCIVLSRDSTCTEVVGVAADAFQYQLGESTRMQYYVPLGQQSSGHRTLWIRSRGDPHAIVGDVQRALARAGPDLPYVSVRTLGDLIEPQYQAWRLPATILGLFGGLALVLAGLGLYGVLAYTVAQRTQEIGVRVALGAEPGDVFGLVIRQGVGVAAIGIVVGALLALAAGKALASLLYGVAPSDPLVLTLAAAVLLGAAALASWVPARRATKVDPVVALRSE